MNAEMNEAMNEGVNEDYRVEAPVFDDDESSLMLIMRSRQLRAMISHLQSRLQKPLTSLQRLFP